METQTETAEDCECNIHPSVFFLFGTLLVTSCSTAMLCAAIMTDHWEHVTWSRTMLEALVNGTSISLQWYLDGAVVKVVDKNRDERLQRNTFLVPMNGGIWTLCVTLSEDEIRLLSQIGFPKNFACNNYLITGGGGVATKEDGTDFFKTDWQHRMQNLSISCALVCLIVLGSAALVGAFGVCKHQISAVLVTGVMYLLAALFALFTLMIIHLKRIQTKPRIEGSGMNGAIDGVIAFGGGRNMAIDLIEARIFSTSWSLDLGWGGVALCTVTSIFWILLSKLMRFNPISAMLV